MEPRADSLACTSAEAWLLVRAQRGTDPYFAPAPALPAAARCKPGCTAPVSWALNQAAFRRPGGGRRPARR
jgi:hypothetical protein